MSTLKTIAALEEAGLLHARDPRLVDVAARYAVAVTPAMASLIDASDPADPIARQFVPDARELDLRPEERADPIGDKAHQPVPGIVHRYRDRVLLKLVHVCPVYCRFCFRREMIGPGAEAPLAGKALDAALDYIRTHEEIWEVILTGGDPFIVPPKVARAVTAALEAIPHVKVIRWHTRVPIADPVRVTDGLAGAIAAREKAVYVAIHTNHARELAPEACAAIERLRGAGIPLLSQTVLLAGINDDADVLERLFRALIELKVKPYYLHQADLAPGTSHFRVPMDRAQAVYAELRARLSGIALPAFVLDIPGGYGKVPIHQGHVHGTPGSYTIADDRGTSHEYPPRA